MLASGRSPVATKVGLVMWVMSDKVQLMSRLTIQQSLPLQLASVSFSGTASVRTRLCPRAGLPGALNKDISVVDEGVPRVLWDSCVLVVYRLHR